MSTMNAIVAPGQVSVLTDAAIYDWRTGILTSIESKAFVPEGINAVVSTRGLKIVNQIMQCAFDGLRSKSFDEFRDLYLEKTVSALKFLMDTIAPGHDYEVMISGWSDENNRGEILFWHTYKNAEWPAAYDVILSEDAIFQGVEYDFSANDLSTFDPRIDGVALIEHGRGERYDLSLGSMSNAVIGYAIGGFIELHTVTANGVTSEVIHRFNDRVGEMIDPFAEDQPDVAASASVSFCDALAA